MTDRCCPSATEPGQPHSPPAHSSVSPCSEPRVSQFIKKYVASCLLISDTNTELSYILPSEAVKKGCFERLFQVTAGAGGVDRQVIVGDHGAAGTSCSPHAALCLCSTWSRAWRSWTSPVSG